MLARWLFLSSPEKGRFNLMPVPSLSGVVRLSEADHHAAYRLHGHIYALSCQGSLAFDRAGSSDGKVMVAQFLPEMVPEYRFFPVRPRMTSHF